MAFHSPFMPSGNSQPMSGPQKATLKVSGEGEVLAPPDDVPPSETLYINNLNTRIKENIWKPFLEKMFSKSGPCHVIVMSSLRRRGQAWVIYEALEHSKAAMDSYQGHIAFGKKMRISFSNNVSDITRNRKGMPVRDKNEQGSNNAPNKRQKTEANALDDFFSASITAPKASSTSRAYNPPNKVLFIENLSDKMDIESLQKLFSQFKGFIEVRIIAGRGVAFAEFIDEYTSQVPLNKLHGYEVERGRFIVISNAKK